MDRDDNLYSDERLKELLRDRTSSDTKEIIRYVCRDVEKFTGETPQSDDITMLAVKFKKS